MSCFSGTVSGNQTHIRMLITAAEQTALGLQDNIAVSFSALRLQSLWQHHLCQGFSRG